MFLKTINGDKDISKRLCSQATNLRTRLQQHIDKDELSSAIKIAEASITNDCIVALLAMMQSVDRDPNNDFRPISTSSDASLEMADVALLTLSDLYTMAEMHLKLQGWHPVDQSDKVSGGIVYEHDNGEISEEPNYEKMSWQMKLMLSIPVLIEPGCVDGEVVWAATVVHYEHGAQENQSDLECSELSPNCISVIDVLKSDEDGKSSRLRGTYNGCWRGLYADALGEMDTSHSIGQRLESWTETTLAGLSVANEESTRILMIGLGCGQLVSFLQNHVAGVELQVVEASQSIVDIAVKYYQFPTCALENVHIIDPIEYVKRQCSQGQVGGEYDTIIVNVCSSDDVFPNHLLNDQFFNGLVSMLSNHPTATLLVNSGVSADVVSTLVDEACKHIHGHRSGHALLLREYLLRDHSTSDDEGVIVAARRREWSLTVEDWQREHYGDNAQFSGAMDVTNAQRTQVVRLEKFLSLEDIETIRSVAKAKLASIEPASSALEKHTNSWKVLYLQSDDTFQQKLPALRQRILEAVRQVDKDNWHLFDNVDHVNIRVVEYHQMDEYGELADPRHYDLNSLLTMDMMLSEDGAFEGGDLQTEEVDGTLKKHEFKQGDALIFVSHKYHCVNRVRSGRRNVMVLEFWYGPERLCSHRCEKFGSEICMRDPGQDMYTQQFHPNLKQRDDSSTSILFPFRLGSVSACKADSREILELLWEPCGNTEVEPNKPLVAAKEQVDDKALSDAFACFGDSDSDSDDDSLAEEYGMTTQS